MFLYYTAPNLDKYGFDYISLLWAWNAPCGALPYCTCSHHKWQTLKISKLRIINYIKYYQILVVYKHQIPPTIHSAPPFLLEVWHQVRPWKLQIDRLPRWVGCFTVVWMDLSFRIIIFRWYHGYISLSNDSGCGFWCDDICKDVSSCICMHLYNNIFFVIRQAYKSTRNNSLLLPAMIEFGIPASDPVAPLPPHRSGGSPALEPAKKNRQITHPSFRIIQGI